MIANLNTIMRLGGEPPVPTYPPIADFTSNTQSIVVGGSINYIDQSTVDPLGPPITSWYWQFEGGNPIESYSQNPSGISYATNGTFDVSLMVTNADGSNTKLKQDYITVNEIAPPVILNSWFNSPYMVNNQQTTGTDFETGPYYTKLL